MKKQKNEKIKKWKRIKKFTLIGFVTSVSVGVTAIFWNNRKAKISVKSQKNNFQTLIEKIKDKDLIIDKNVDTSSDAKILLAIKNQLKVENPLLSNKDLLNVSDNITSLTPGVKTNVVLTILIDNKSNTINIKIIRPLSDLESVSAVKTALKNLSFKTVTIVATFGTITDNKEAIINDLNLLIKSSKIDLKGTNIAIKEEDTELTLKGVPFTILISKGTITQEIGSEFMVKRVKNNVEKNKKRIALIKSKIKVRTFDIDKNVDTSNDVKTLLAIKNQLKVENPLLTSEDLSKIDDNITLLAPNKKTSVTLIISIGSESDTVKISIERSYSDLESVNFTKNQLEDFYQKEITVSATSGTITDNKDLIVKTLKKNYWFSIILGKYRTSIAIKEENTRLTLQGVPFTILVSKGALTKEISSLYIVKRSRTNEEENKYKVAKIKNKIINKNLVIGKNVNTSNDAALLQAIKNQLNVENLPLTNEELSKITDNISSLVPEKRTPVILTILVGTESDTVKIWITRPLSDLESVNIVKKELEKLSPKEIQISATSGTITNNKQAIFAALNSLIKSSSIGLKGTNIAIKEEDTQITLLGTPFTIKITKGAITKEISSFKVKRSKNTQEINNDKINAIKNKIVDKNLIIDKDVDTFNDAKILLAIKNQLKIQNPSLTSQDLLKINDSIDSLTPGVKTNVVLTILVDIESDTINIEVTRPLSDFESVDEVKNELEKLVSKEIQISATSGTITDNKQAIFVALNSLIKSSNIGLKGTNIAIKEEDTELTLNGVPFTIKITKGITTKEITSTFIVKRSLTNQEIISKIKSKIKIKILTIPKNIDNSNDAKILLAIKNQLKIQNPSLTNQDLLKINDSIDSLTPGVKTNVVLTISIDTESDTINIEVTRPLSDFESVDEVKNELEKLVSKEIQISATSGTITDNKQAIFVALNSLIKSSNIGLKGTNISIKEEDTELTLSGVPFIVLISKGATTKEIVSFKVKRSKNTQEINNDKINTIKDKIKNKDLIINKDVDTSNDAKILLAIKNQLKKQNPSLTSQDLLKITDSIDSLIPGIKTNVILTISIDTESDTIDIEITRPLNDLELVDEVKNEIENLAPKEINIDANSGTITDNKQAIKNALDSLIISKKIDLKGTKISIKEEDTELTLSGVPFIVLISKGTATKEITSIYTVKRSKNTQEINNDKVNAIKDKIKDKELIIDKDVDTSNDAKILLAIKNQLKVENPLLNDEDLEKISDNISSLTPEKWLPVILKISVGTQFDTININVFRPLSELETFNHIKEELEKISPKEITINATSGTINNNKRAIKNALDSLINSKEIDLKGATISIKSQDTKLTLSGVPFTILASTIWGSSKEISLFKVKRSKNTQEINNDKVNEIKNKIKDKNLIIDKDVDTSTDAKILLAIKNQLKKQNLSLTSQDLLKITDSIDSLIPGVKTNVILTISIDTESDTIDIEITRPLNDLELVDEVKNELENLAPKEINIDATSGTVTNNKQAVLDALKLLISSKKIDLKGTKVLVKEEDTELTLNGVPFTILISKGDITKEITNWKVKRSKNIQEINNDKINAIKDKIKNKELIIDKNIDTSDDAKILLAIKNQLKTQNSSLSDEDLLKITDDVSSLTPGVKTNVVLTISIDTESDTININVIKSLTDLESVNAAKKELESLSPKEITISATSGTITDNKQAILDALKLLISSKNIDLKETNILVKEKDTELTLNGIPFTILISKGDITKEITSIYTVKRSKNNQEINNDKINEIKNKIKDKNLIIDKDVDTSNDAKILLAIKNQLKKQNPSLTNQDLLKITDDVSSLTPGVKTNVVLTISIDTESDTVNIEIIRPLSDLESVDEVKKELENLSPKEITIITTSGTITDNKPYIINGLKLLISSKDINLKGTNVLVKEENTELTLNGVPFTIKITKGTTTKEIISIYTVKRSKNNQEINNDKVNEIKDKIKDKNLIIDKDVDTSNDAKILLAIKNQLKKQNPSLTDQDLLKINDSIDSLTPGVRTNVVLTISVGTQSDNINVEVFRALSDIEIVDELKNELEKLSPKEITISATSGTITDNKQAILDALKLLISSKNIDLKETNILVKEENTKITLLGVLFTIKITKGLINQEITSIYTVKRSKNNQEINNDKVNEIKNKIKDKNLIIDKDVDTSTDAKILLAIKNQLKKQNPSLTNQDLLKITDDVDSLTPGVKTNVVLTISIGTESDTININVIKSLTDLESVKALKKELESLSPKEITISATSGTVTNNKQAILDALKLLISSKNIDLNETNVLVKEEDTELTLNGIPFTILISKGDITEEITSIYTVKRSLTNQEIVSRIKAKIQDKVLIIPKNVDTSNDAKILLAIRNQLKVENPSLNDKELEKIADNIINLKPEKKIPVILKIKSGNISELIKIFVTKKRNIKLWTKNSAILKGSNVDDGVNGRIFQDSSGNLWIMSYKKRLQVLKRDSSQWTSSTTSGLTKGSNIEYGMSGILFEDTFGNLWAMGRKWEYDKSKLREGKLQVLIKNKDGNLADSWIDTNEKLLKGSNIKNGYDEAAIFEDSSGNIWAMSENTKLKVLKKQKDGTFVDSWTDDNSEKGEKLLRGSNIINGKKGFIFEDSSGNIWTMAKGTRLQVLAKKKDGTFEDRWNSKGKLLSGSNINNGELGIMFEDSFGNLWAIAKNTKLQVLRKKQDGTFANAWTNNNEPLLKDSNVKNSEGGIFIFQDSSKNLWIMSKDSKLQVLKANQNGDGYVDSWTNNNGLNNEETSDKNDKRKWNIRRRPLNNDNSNNKKIEPLLKNSKINNGWFGFIFEDSSGNLWAMGDGSKLQVLVKNKDGSFRDSWTDDNSKNGEPLLKGSKINNGQYGFIFEDSSGNLWAMANGSKLQVFDKTQQRWIS